MYNKLIVDYLPKEGRFDTSQLTQTGIPNEVQTNMEFFFSRLSEQNSYKYLSLKTPLVIFLSIIGFLTLVIIAFIIGSAIVLPKKNYHNNNSPSTQNTGQLPFPAANGNGTSNQNVTSGSNSTGAINGTGNGPINGSNNRTSSGPPPISNGTQPGSNNNNNTNQFPPPTNNQTNSAAGQPRPVNPSTRQNSGPTSSSDSSPAHGHNQDSFSHNHQRRRLLLDEQQSGQEQSTILPDETDNISSLQIDNQTIAPNSLPISEANSDYGMFYALGIIVLIAVFLLCLVFTILICHVIFRNRKYKQICELEKQEVENFGLANENRVILKTVHEQKRIFCCQCFSVFFFRYEVSFNDEEQKEGQKLFEENGKMMSGEFTNNNEFETGGSLVFGGNVLKEGGKII